MEQRYWDKFMETGSVKDYLSYKAGGFAENDGQKEEKSMGVSSSESDRTNRNGAFYGTRWGI
ncbi:hypothetical protein [Clostridium sp. C105KSO13]|uniref:hypothetical protein n=1 Tax=Clostridium sp. C105KSO13 TaxID=1776045 RepID=UPI000740718A|nr:hypothetical protein [Clostridium sp. C105KSO13]CUX39387.1 hypothetical protein BN3456_01982 [Clostridium sp. C105KSO13]